MPRRTDGVQTFVGPGTGGRRITQQQRRSDRASQATPERIMQIAWSFSAAHTLATALDLRLFTHIAEGKNTEAALRAATEASERGLRMLLNALTGMGLLSREDSRYRLAPDAEAFLVEGRAVYHGDFARLHVRRISREWASLTECVRTGRPVTSVETPEQGAELWDELVDTLMPVNYAAARALGGELCRLRPRGELRLLDVAAGSGVWGIAAAQRDPRVHVTVFDLPATLPHARHNAEKLGLAARFEYRAGDIRHDSLGEREFHAVVLGHICHSEGAEHARRLLEKTARALKPGGTVAIAEFVPDDDRAGPAQPLLFALNMLVHTSEGDTFTFAEYSEWLRDAGFRGPRRFQAPAPSPLILATRA